MKIISINVGLPRLAIWNGRTISTGIFKSPVSGHVKLRRLNLEGDRQSDLAVHGGVTKAVYAYPVEHYDYWRRELPGMELPWGMFGENFTTEGMFEDEMRIGDRFSIRSAEVMVTEPRMPCYKLGVKFGRSDIIKRFLASGRTGFYLSVLQEGEVASGDTFELIGRDEANVTIADVVRLYARQRDDTATLRRAIASRELPESWRIHFEQQLAGLAMKIKS